jgi:hypothetical protein
MTVLSHSKFRELSESARDYAVSIYVPTHIAGPDIRQDPIRLKNLLSDAESQLQQAGLTDDDIRARLSAAFALLDNLEFWRYQHHGLALFLTEQESYIYRLPLEVEPLVTVANRFHLKPLFPLFFNNKYFYILAFSQNHVRFFQATQHQISEITLENVPTSLAEALQYDDPEKQLQYHSTGGNGRQPTYHGQGAGTADDKTDVRRFLSQVESGVYSYLNTEMAPLVLASVEYLQPIYRELSQYQHILPEGIAGNPDEMNPDDLRVLAWPKVEPLVEQSHRDALSEFQELLGTGKTVTQMAHLLPAAHHGQIDTLFVESDAHCWGQFDSATGTLDIHQHAQPLDIDLLDLAAVQTFLQGGKVYTLDSEELPNSSSSAAILRYGIPAQV